VSAGGRGRGGGGAGSTLGAAVVVVGGVGWVKVVSRDYPACRVAWCGGSSRGRPGGGGGRIQQPPAAVCTCRLGRRLQASESRSRRERRGKKLAGYW
jgi:hypothetical protein